ncbi:MAG TPA: UbiA family prenyltransferase [Bacillota bacterium]|nr:UbiA family prenyltransferase [Bacillota bacterium]
MFKRWGIYLQESFAPLVRFIWCFILCMAVYSILKNVYPGQMKFSWLTTMMGTLNCFFFLLYVRVTDEFKDYKVDQKYFPQRPVPSGKISLKDLTILKFTIIGCLLLLNLIYPGALLEFGIALVAFYLMSKWFFLEKYLGGNRILALITHSPMYLLLFYFIIALYVNGNGISAFSVQHVYLALWVWTPLLAWELGRKTYAPADEQEGYQTYSKMLGYKTSTILTIVIILLHGLMLFLLRHPWRISSITLIIAAILVGLVSVSGLLFLKNPSPKNNHLKAACELYQLVALALIWFNQVTI